MELCVGQGDFGLPSLDCDSLAVLSYCKFSDVPVTVHKFKSSWRSPIGKFPVLNEDGVQKTSVSSIIHYLRQKNWGTDFELSIKQSADIVAFTAMVEQKLKPALRHLWWVDSQTFTDLTRPWYAKTLPFPLGVFLPGRKHKHEAQRLSALYNEEYISEADRESKIIRDAKECMNMLSAKLGDQDYFFGKTPSSLDSTVFSYLALLWKVPFPNNVLKNHLKGCTNLCGLCQRILDKYFPLSKEDIEEQKKKEEEQRQKQMDGSAEFPHRKRNMVIAGVVAVTAMVVFAFYTGLVAIEITDEGDDRGDAGTEADMGDFDDGDYYDGGQEDQE